MLSFNLSKATIEDWNQFNFFVKNGSRFNLAEILCDELDFPLYIRQGNSDIDNFAQIFISKEYSFLPLTPSSILDLGGYIGMASIYLSSCYPDASIVLVEPDPDNFLLAQLNCRGYKNIQCVNAGVWSHSCSITIASKDEGDWGTMFRPVLPEEKICPTIPAFSVSDLMNKYSMSDIDFLKIDIEGSEKVVFSESSCAQWIPKCKVISCELHDRMLLGCSNAFHSAMKKHEFIHHKYGEFDYYTKTSINGLLDQ